MNLYAVLPEYAPGADVKLVLAGSITEAMEHGIDAAEAVANPFHPAPTAAVYLIAADVPRVGTARTTEWTDQ